jgi:chromosome segregation ATPase
MNVENIKSELQQVLESDIALRKDYNEVKRSLSDYRNQLIERDEDCKRLQVSIDVLNTKLVVMERDNTNFKGEVSSFKDLRNTIREQLNEKQEEISNLISKIESLENQLLSISSEYENKIEEIQSHSKQTISDLTLSYENQLEELKSNSSYQQNGMRSELESKISDLTSAFNTKHDETVSSYEEKLTSLTNSYTSQIENLKSESKTQIEMLSSSSTESVTSLTENFELKISGLIHNWELQKSEIISTYESQVSGLNEELSLQKSNFEIELASTLDKLNFSFVERENELSVSHQNELAIVISNSENVIESLKIEYESRLSNAVIHSTSQASKLTDDLSGLLTENEHFKEKIREMVYHIDNQNSQIENFTNELAFKTNELSNQIEAFTNLNSEFDNYKLGQLSSTDEQLVMFNAQIANLENSISLKNENIVELSDLINEKTIQISDLSTNCSNLETIVSELNHSLVLEKETFEGLKNELEVTHSQQLAQNTIEFDKLLTENTSLISEIDAIADKLEATEEEMSLVKSELSELKIISDGKASDLKDTLSSKNFELTNLSANNSALLTEVEFLKMELESKNNELIGLKSSLELSSSHAELIEGLNATKMELENQIGEYKNSVTDLTNQVSDLFNTIAVNEAEIVNLKSVTKSDEQEAFIDRLFKQIDTLTDERLNLLNEKGEMANQLLKMNESISGLSQQVDSHHVDISELDNHRKNVILAKGSSNDSSDKTIMKKQINELVREIDKCIALLSA